MKKKTKNSKKKAGSPCGQKQHPIGMEKLLWPIDPGPRAREALRSGQRDL